MVDILTGWNETGALPNKARKWVVDALDAHRHQFPSPSGASIPTMAVNLSTITWWRGVTHHITFTRSRVYHKNDGCYVEKKNWTVVRRFVGYARYEGSAPVAWLNALYATLRLYTNFFHSEWGHYPLRRGTKSLPNDLESPGQPLGL